MQQLKRAIVERAQAHGFDLCRIARPVIGERHRRGLERWVEQGMQGDMDYMSEAMRVERRKHPQQMLEEVQSVITLAMRHTPPAHTLDEVARAARCGVIASYAHGDDYHETVKKRLKALARDLDAILGPHDQRVFVDTAPVLEHALAEASGLGWQGKHTLTINRGLGSWLMLGEIYTTAELVPDAPASFHCGSCTACLDICPTGAIVAPFVVDARRCISYLTIEYRGFIPRPLRPLMGNHIFGCDDCQLICPWNRHATAPAPDLLVPRKENILPELASLLQLDEAAFRSRFRKSPVRRTGRAGLLRNVCIAIGNSGDTSLLPLMLQAMGDESALVRGHAAWALGELADAGSAATIIERLTAAHACEHVVEVLEEIETTLHDIRDLYGNT